MVDNSPALRSEFFHVPAVCQIVPPQCWELLPDAFRNGLLDLLGRLGRYVKELFPYASSLVTIQA